MASSLPVKHRALVLESIEAGFQVKSVSTPQPGPGSAVVKIEHAAILSYHREIYNGERQYPFPTPLVGGTSAIGRIASLGQDATALQVGQLVFIDCVIRARDNPTSLFLTASHEGSSDGSRKLMREVWRDGMFAEYAKMPLENCIPLDEARLYQDLGYRATDILYAGFMLLVGYGGLRSIQLEPGETIVVCPATGGFGGAAVQTAIAMRARVIAMGRNEKELARLKQHIKNGTSGASIETVRLSGDEATDTAALQAFGTIDAVMDLSPPAAAKSTHMRSAINALRHEGRVSLMGFCEIPSLMWKIVGSDVTMKGKLMYSRDDMLQFVKMLERGLFPKGGELVDTREFSLSQWKEGLDAAAEHTGIGKQVVFSP